MVWCKEYQMFSIRVLKSNEIETNRSPVVPPFSCWLLQGSWPPWTVDTLGHAFASQNYCENQIKVVRHWKPIHLCKQLFTEHSPLDMLTTLLGAEHTVVKKDNFPAFVNRDPRVEKTENKWIPTETPHIHTGARTHTHTHAFAEKYIGQCVLKFHWLRQREQPDEGLENGVPGRWALGWGWDRKEARMAAAGRTEQRKESDEAKEIGRSRVTCWRPPQEFEFILIGMGNHSGWESYATKKKKTPANWRKGIDWKEVGNLTGPPRSLMSQVWKMGNCSVRQAGGQNRQDHLLELVRRTMAVATRVGPAGLPPHHLQPQTGVQGSASNGSW